MNDRITERMDKLVSMVALEILPEIKYLRATQNRIAIVAWLLIAANVIAVTVIAGVFLIW
jgi:hypothetical protein